MQLCDVFIKSIAWYTYISVFERATAMVFLMVVSFFHHRVKLNVSK